MRACADLFLSVLSPSRFSLYFLSLPVWYKESDEPTLKLKCLSVYMWANVCNTASSIAYFCIICWALNARFVLAANEKANLSVDPHWYDNQLIAVIFKQVSGAEEGTCAFTLDSVAAPLMALSVRSFSLSSLFSLFAILSLSLSVPCTSSPTWSTFSMRSCSK